MEREPRISLVPVKCMNFMIRTDENQKSLLTPPSTQRYTLYGWTLEESLAWTAFREKIEKVYALYSNPDKTGPAVRETLKLLIKKIRAYDNNRKEGHHLLDKVALFGTIDDWVIFNIKRGTTLASGPTHLNNKSDQIVPNIFLLKNDLGMHVLMVRNPETPASKKLPEGVAFAKIFRCISSETTVSKKEFDFIGNASRGKYLSNLIDIEQDKHTRLFAYYYCRYESKKGLLGLPSAVLRVEILLVSP
jgi:hypothetical protein